VILGVVAEHMKDLSLPHLLLLEPFLWEDEVWAAFDPALRVAAFTIEVAQFDSALINSA
jgi:hypothetical protein